MDAITRGSFSQPEFLIARMEEAGMSHGAKARIDLPLVEAIVERERATALFCSMESLPIRINRSLIDGDGGPIPREVVIQGFDVSRSGFYRIGNVLAGTNGRVELTVDEEAEVELVEATV